MIISQDKAIALSKSGVDMWIYSGRDECPHAAIAYQETAVGHAEEFRHHKSAFIYFIIEGEGEWVIEGEAHPVKAHDVVIVPPGKRFYYRGTLKHVCITAPAWEPEFEESLGAVGLEQPIGSSSCHDSGK